MYSVLDNARVYLNSGLWQSSTWTVVMLFVRARSGYAALGLYCTKGLYVLGLDT